MKSAHKKLKILSAAFIVSLVIFATPVHAASWNAWFQSSFSLDTIIYGVILKIVGGGMEAKPSADASNPTPTLVYNSQPGQLGGILGFGTTTMIAMYDNPPTSTSYYLANLGKEFGIDSAYAQVDGSGAGLIKPVEQLWQILRNVSYMFFIIIFVVIGFMIMLRQKLNPQTVITIQSALPGLVIGLILVTFSYFIAALITDMAFLGVQIVAQIFSSVVDSKGGVVNYFDPVGLAEKSNIFDLYSNSLTTVTKPVENYGEYISTLGSAASNAITPATVIGTVIGGVIFAFTGPWLIAGGALAVLALPLIIVLILLIAFTIQFGKLMFKLVMAYIMILITTATGPLYITMSLLPGRGNMLGMWWKTILGNALVFPAVFALFLFAGMIMKTDQSLWRSTPPFFGDFSTTLIQPIIAFVILLGTPAVPDIVKKAVGASDFGAIGQQGIGGFVGGFGSLQKGVNKFTEPYSKRRAALENGYLSAMSEPDGAKRAAALQGLTQLQNRSIFTRHGIQTFGQVDRNRNVSDRVMRETYEDRVRNWVNNRDAFYYTNTNLAARTNWVANNPVPPAPPAVTPITPRAAPP